MSKAGGYVIFEKDNQFHKVHDESFLKKSRKKFYRFSRDSYSSTLYIYFHDFDGIIFSNCNFESFKKFNSIVIYFPCHVVLQNINFGESSVYINTTSCTESIVANHVTGKYIGLAAQNIFVTDCENVNVLEATDSVFANRCTSLCSAVPINWKAKNLNLSFVNMASYSSIRFSCGKFLYSHISLMAESIQMDHLFHYKKKDGVLYKIMDEDIQRIGMLNRLCSSFKALKV